VVAHKANVLPYMGSFPSPSLFGINTLGYDSNWANYERGVPAARTMGARWVHFTNDSIHFSDGHLSRRTKEMIATYVSSLNRCPY